MEKHFLDFELDIIFHFFASCCPTQHAVKAPNSRFARTSPVDKIAPKAKPSEKVTKTTPKAMTANDKVRLISPYSIGVCLSYLAEMAHDSDSRRKILRAFHLNLSDVSIKQFIVNLEENVIKNVECFETILPPTRKGSNDSLSTISTSSNSSLPFVYSVNKIFSGLPVTSLSLHPELFESAHRNPNSISTLPNDLTSNNNINSNRISSYHSYQNLDSYAKNVISSQNSVNFANIFAQTPNSLSSNNNSSSSTSGGGSDKDVFVKIEYSLGSPAETINKTVKKMTNGHIKNLMNPMMRFSENSVAVSSVAFFQCDWKYPFEMTNLKIFHTFPIKCHATSSSSSQKSAMMKLNDHKLLFFHNRNMKVVSFPFSDENFSMICFLPNKKGESALDSMIKKLFLKTVQISQTSSFNHSPSILKTNQDNSAESIKHVSKSRSQSLNSKNHLFSVNKVISELDTVDDNLTHVQADHESIDLFGGNEKNIDDDEINFADDVKININLDDIKNENVDDNDNDDNNNNDDDDDDGYEEELGEEQSHNHNENFSFVNSGNEFKTVINSMKEKVLTVSLPHFSFESDSFDLIEPLKAFEVFDNQKDFQFHSKGNLAHFRQKSAISVNMGGVGTSSFNKNKGNAQTCINSILNTQKNQETPDSMKKKAPKTKKSKRIKFDHPFFFCLMRRNPDIIIQCGTIIKPDLSENLKVIIEHIH